MLTSFARTRMVGAARSQPRFLRKLGPNFQNTGLEIEPRFPASSKRPVWILDFGFRILDFGFWILDFGFWILDFGFRILDFGFWISDFGFWISDFGFWILDQFSLRPFCGGPKRPRLDFGFWISDFGFWILDFGFWILDFGLGLGSIDTVWILHKIFASHADSGRRIFTPTWKNDPIGRAYFSDGLKLEATN